MKWNVNPLIRAIDRYIQKADEDLEEELKAEGYVATGAAVTAINEIEDKLTDLLNDYTDDLLNRMEKSSDISDFIENVWSDMKTEKDLEEFLIDFLHKKFRSLLNECVKEFLIDADEQLGIDERITKPTQEFIEDWSHELARIMRLNTNKQIEEILIKSQKEAMSIEEVAKAISDSAIRSPGYRARSVALTEVLRIESYSQLEYMRQDPTVEEKEWFHTGSHKNKPRSNHVAINGQKVPKNEPFTLTGADGGTYKPMCPRDTCLPASETVNCHCIMKTIRNEKVMGMTVEERRKLREQYMDQVDEEWEQEYNKEIFGTEDGFELQAVTLPKHMKKYVPDKKRRKEIIKKGIALKKPIFDNEALGKYAKYIIPEEKYYDVVLHGAPNYMLFFDEIIDAETLGAIIIQRDDYKKGTPIRLISCRTGENENGVAQYLANKLNVEVLAPNKNVSLHYKKERGKINITLQVESRPNEKDGEWVHFIPQ